MVKAVVDFGRAWLDRFIDVAGVDRSMALAAQAFSALIPLIIVGSAIVPRGDGESAADGIIERFDLTGATAQSVREAFTSSQTVEDSISALGVLLLLVSALSFTRGMQRLYEGCYGLSNLGMKNTRLGLVWLAMLAGYSAIQQPLAGLIEADWLRIVVALTLAAAAWTVTPYLLLGKRMPWLPLLPGATLTAVGMTAFGASSIIWFPRTMATSAEQFGVMGVAFAMLSWLVAASFVIVIAATGGSVIHDRLNPHTGDGEETLPPGRLASEASS
jgi:membrane protein